ncbi:aspartate/glutamate racemase family protein [Terasakiella sp. A23]|uniref:maleate cis-trans isomerase family protein n=1 Tax=Terasakiella sp. FCG-A23 TaxID=3080561 RepID=UPI00295452B0|nr:aspartate/glutamate racemase family protein [Terasakiella sp. A23]MDV7341487.1 aspartate/glutamate racemase family protein [Terasakiella sp. A23]
MTNFVNIQPQLPLEHLASGGRIGLVALATDFNIESDLNRMYPDDVEFFTSRVRNYNPLTIENLRRMAPGISAATDNILPGTDLDAVIYACTSATVAIGNDNITSLIHKARPGVKVTNPVTSAVAALETFNAKKVSVLTSYTEAVNHEIARMFQENGYDVLNVAGFGFEDDTAMTDIQPKDIYDAAIQICAADADLLFISCTALRASLVIEEIERKLGIPVASSNQVLAWHSLRLVDYARPVNGFGRLLSDHLVK